MCGNFILPRGEKSLWIFYSSVQLDFTINPLDTDIYLIEQTEIEKMLSDEQGLSAVNEIVFKIYLASITDNMIDLLCNEEVEIDDVVGIEDNE